MDYETIQRTLGENATELITMGNSIHPALGGAIALLMVGAFIWLGIRAKKQKWSIRKKKAGEAISGTGQEQGIAKGSQKDIDSFLDGN